MLKCPGLTPEEQAYAEKVRSVGWTYTAGRSGFHGDQGTLREQEREIIANAKRRNDTEPEYVGPRSKMRPYKELASE